MTAALAARSRGHDVTLVDPGPIPYRDAESTDISKVVRLDYGADEATTAMMENALERWREWNRRWGEEVFQETGVLFATSAPMKPGTFEHDSMEVLVRRGHRLERLDAAAIASRFPAFAPGALVDGYFNPVGGWAASGAVVEKLVQDARNVGVNVEAGVHVERLVERGARITGILDAEGKAREADIVIVAAGSWTTRLCPWLAPHLRATGQPVFHLTPRDRLDTYRAPSLPVFGADLATSGWYGFPAQRSGVVKVANHGVGRSLEQGPPLPGATSKREASDAERGALRAFFARVLPALDESMLVATRICVYCDTADGHFWIAPDPEREGLVVASGGSGHGFKFAPLLGDIIADAMEGKVDPRYRWRPEAINATSEEAARAR